MPIEFDAEWSVVQATLDSMSVHRRQVVARDPTGLIPLLTMEEGLWIRTEAGLREEAEDLPPDMLVNFRAKNATRHDLLEVFPELSELCLPLDSTELDSAFRGRLGWWRFRCLHPFSGGVVSLSRVAFDETLSQGLICCGRQSGLRAGVGWWKLFRRIFSEWRETWSTLAWMS